MKNEPDFNNPQVYRRLKQAYSFCRAFLSETKSTPVARDLLRKHLGERNRDVSKWLYDTLLICTNEYYNAEAGITKEYQLSPEGMSYLRDILKNSKFAKRVEVARREKVPKLNYANLPAEFLADENLLFDYLLVREFILREFIDQLQRGEFEYKDKSHRLWNGLQNIKSVYRKVVMAEYGFKHDYDIEACAPTLLSQAAQQLQEAAGDEVETLTFINEYLTDRHKVREHLCKVGDITIAQSKIFVNALFCKARLGANPRFALFPLLNCDKAKVKALKADDYVIGLIKDIDSLWHILEPITPRREFQVNKERSITLPINSQDRWDVYFTLEREVMDTIQQYLIEKEPTNKYFLEHDGFRTKKKVNTEALIEYVFQNTGFKIILH